MDPQEELELELEMARARARGGGKKMGHAEAATFGVFDGLTANFDDELVKGQAYAKKMGELGYKAMPDGALDVMNPGVSLARRLFDPTYKPPEKPKLSREEAHKQAIEYARQEQASLRGFQDKARQDRPVSYGAGSLAGTAATLPVGGGVAKGATTIGKAGAEVLGNLAARATGKEVATVAAEKGAEVSAKSLAPWWQKVLTTMREGAVGGAGYGAAAGAGDAKEGERLAGAARGGAEGAVFGAAAAPVLNLAGKGAGALWTVLSRSPDQKAVAMLARMMNKDRVTVDDARKLVEERTAGGTPHFETAGETMGPGAAGMQTALSTITGPSQDILRNAFRKSIADARIYITDAAKRATGKDPGAFHEEKAAHDVMRLKRDAKNYGEVEGDPLDPNRPGLPQFLDAMFTVKKGEEHLPPVGHRPIFHDYVAEVAKQAAKDGDNAMSDELNKFLAEVRPQDAAPPAAKGVREIDTGFSSLRKQEAGSDKLQVLVNPTNAEIARLRVLPAELQRGGRRDVRLRYLQDADKNVYVWRGDLATHEEVAPRLGVKLVTGRGASAADRGMVDVQNGKVLFDGEAGRPGVNDARLPTQALSNRAINAIDKAIGQDIEVAVSRTRNNDVRRLTLLRKAMHETDPFTGLGDARGESWVGVTAQQAFDKGRKAFQNQVDLEDVTGLLGNGTMPQEIKDNFLMGMVRSMSDRLANQSNLSELADAAGKIASTPAQRDKLISALKSDASGKLTPEGHQFLDMLDRVHNHVTRAKANYGGSATAPRLKAVEEADAESGSMTSDLADLVGEILMREKGKIMGRVGGRVRDWATRPGIRNPDINEALGTRLAAQGKDGVAKVLNEVETYIKRPTPRLMDPRIPPAVAAILAGRMAHSPASSQRNPRPAE